MKKVFNFVFGAVAALLCIVACQKNVATPELQDGEHGLVVVSVNPEYSTKADGAAVDAEKAESAIRSLQVFVFYGESNAALGQVAYAKETDRYETFTGTASSQNMTLTTTTGKKYVYALVNAPRLTNVTDVTDLKGRVLYLGNNYLAPTTVGSESRLGLVMAGAYGYTSGDAQINVDGSIIEIGAYTQGLDASITSVPINMYRLPARIELQNIKVDFRGTWLEGLNFTVKEIYLKNIPNGVNFTGQNSTLLSDSGYWTNKITREASPVDKSSLNVAPLVYELRASGGTACSVAGVDTPMSSFFYTYPNSNTVDQTADAWSQRRTRLVIHAVISGTNSLGADFGSGKDYYYPISIAKPEAFVADGSSTPASSPTHTQIVGNHKYVVNRITITGLGKPNDDNDSVPESGRAKVEVSVQDWNGTTVLNYEF